MTYYLYILFSKHLNKFYVGYSSDLEQRLRKHNTSNKSFTGKSNDWEIVYTEKYSSKTETMAREIQIKKWKSRKLIQKLIENQK